MEIQNMEKFSDSEKHISARLVEGATSKAPHVFEDDTIPLESKVEYAKCPQEFADFVESTSLEKLVYWKLKNLVEHLADNHQGDDESDVWNQVLSHVERPLFSLAMKKTNGNISQAAKLLGCNRNTLHRKLVEFQMLPKELRRILKERNVQRLAQRRHQTP